MPRWWSSAFTGCCGKPGPTAGVVLSSAHLFNVSTPRRAFFAALLPVFVGRVVFAALTVQFHVDGDNTVSLLQANDWLSTPQRSYFWGQDYMGTTEVTQRRSDARPCADRLPAVVLDRRERTTAASREWIVRVARATDVERDERPRHLPDDARCLPMSHS